jgi:hypothetical protein
MNSQWSIENAYALSTKIRKFAEDYEREYISLFTNLNRIVQHLNGGAKIGGFQIGFFRPEGGGVYRIGQSAVPYAKESRLYTFPNQDNQTIYILTIGTKDRQTEDINEAKAITEQIRIAIAKKPDSKQTSEQ